ncbi:MAG: alpha/beta hydrolase [Ignavibacteria bacterium]|jgi:alpha-beta hydrolase superfamily lysophospholipase|nr:alpha/beta hydrolase [Ignavibacteria bacterium]
MKIKLFLWMMLLQAVLLAQADTVLHVSRIEDINFTSGRFQIAGSLYLPDLKHERYPVIIWVPGSGQSFRKVKNKETIKLINCILDRGFAYFRIDKPGCGDSKGKVNDDSLFAEFSDIFADAIKKLNNHPTVDRSDMGLFGSSQAGYIMPLVISKSKDISFMIGSSCPGENSMNQWNYLLEKQMICEGITPERAKKNIEMFSALRNTTDKEVFDKAVNYYKNNPMVVSSLGYDSSFYKIAESWWPRVIDEKDESHFNPMSVMEKVTIPCYLVYGKNDTQIDPVQAMQAYKDAFAKSGNRYFRIEMLSNSDHNMSLSGGCLNEISELNQSGDYRYDPEYIKLISSWLDEWF